MGLFYTNQARAAAIINAENYFNDALLDNGNANPTPKPIVAYCEDLKDFENEIQKATMLGIFIWIQAIEASIPHHGTKQPFLDPMKFCASVYEQPIINRESTTGTKEKALKVAENVAMILENAVIDPTVKSRNFVVTKIALADNSHFKDWLIWNVFFETRDGNKAISKRSDA